mmetsp:Transcript_27184/g.88833  ORF Transcript_27184/g.88833 Transcript_27184/m.88833 type:complete len:694 (+) Transcript_27184:149-2230(+)
MPLVPHPPSSNRPDHSNVEEGPQRMSSGGSRQRDINSFALAQKAGLPTLNFVKLKQGGTENDGFLSQRGEVQGVGAGSSRTRSYGSASNQTSQVGQHASYSFKPSSNGYKADVPHVRRVVQGAQGGFASGLMPHPPSERGSEPSSRDGGRGSNAGSDIPERSKQEPAYPLTARNHAMDSKDAASMNQAKHSQVPQTARAAFNDAHQDGHNVAPQKYDEVTKANPTGGSNVPLTPAAALKLYMNSMTLYEQGEILDYPQVYYVGPNAQKHKPTADATDNHGFDDDRGDYLWVMHDHVSYRYEILGVLGKGSFGVVTKCYDWKTNQLVALKIIRNKKRFHHQALVEVKLLEHLRDHDTDGTASIVHMKDHFYFRNHMCITFELLCINLYEFIKNNKFQGLSLGLIRRVAVQLLLSLRFLRKLRVIHCDLKPENILLKAPNKSSIKVIDFGSSCFENERVYTYIQSRFYRSPEVILGLPYDMAIDMWSFGCILAELYTGYPIFPGENEVEQLACIMEIQGLPPRMMIEQASRKKMFFDSNGAPRIVPNSRGKKRRPASKDLASALRCSDPAFVSFLEGCLQWDKKDRFTPDQALQHEWITEAAIPSTSISYRRAASEVPFDSQPRMSVGATGGVSGSLSARGPVQASMNSIKRNSEKRQVAAGYMTFRDRHLFPPIDPLAPKSARGVKQGGVRVGQ